MIRSALFAIAMVAACGRNHSNGNGNQPAAAKTVEPGSTGGDSDRLDNSGAYRHEGQIDDRAPDRRVDQVAPGTSVNPTGGTGTTGTPYPNGTGTTDGAGGVNGTENTSGSGRTRAPNPTE